LKIHRSVKIVSIVELTRIPQPWEPMFEFQLRDVSTFSIHEYKGTEGNVWKKCIDSL